MVDRRAEFLELLVPNKIIRGDIRLLLAEYDLAAKNVVRLRRRLILQARGFEPIGRFIEVPGVHWVRGGTFFAYVDTPWRFERKSALWRYMGIGLERRHSGAGPELVRVVPSYAVSRPLKCMILGAAKSAVAAGNNPFAERYQRWQDEGVTPRNALRNTARVLATTLWGLWKNGSVYHPEWVGVALEVVPQRC